MKSPSILLLFAIASCLAANALPLRVLAWDEKVAERDVWIVHGKKSFQVTNMHPAARTAPNDLPADAEAVFLETRDRKGTDGTSPKAPLKIPANATRPLLLLLPDKTSDTGLRAVIIEDDTSSFPWGTIRMINTTGKPLVFRHEKRLTRLKPDWNPVKIAPGGETRNMEIALHLPDKPTQPLYSAIWEHRNELRQLVFVASQPDQSLGPVGFKFITENLKVAEADAAEAESSKP